MHISVKNVLGKVYPTDLDDAATLKDLKTHIQDQQGIPPEQQRFMVLAEEEIDTLPYSDDKINDFCKRRHRDLRGETTALTQLGVKENDTLLLVLSLRSQEDEIPSLVELLRDLSWTSREKHNTSRDVEFITNSYRENRTNPEVAERACKALFFIYVEQPELLRNNTILNDIFEDFKTQTSRDVIQAMMSFFEGACRANTDGMILKLIDMGVIKEAMKKLQEFRGENKYTLSDTQLGIRDFLREAAKNHEPLRAEVAAAFNKDTLASEEHYIVGKHLTTYNAGYHLWEKPLKLFEKSRYETELEITLLEVKGINLASKDSNGLSDPYFEMGVEPEYQKSFKPQVKSHVIKKTLNPVWDMNKEKKDTVKFLGEQDIRLMVYDHDLIGSDFMGQVEFNATLLYALQEAGLDSPLPFITLGMELESFERTSKNIKHHSVSGEIIVKMHIKQTQK